jgi:hypothetical protein
MRLQSHWAALNKLLAEPGNRDPKTNKPARRLGPKLFRPINDSDVACAVRHSCGTLPQLPAVSHVSHVSHRCRMHRAMPNYLSGREKVVSVAGIAGGVRSVSARRGGERLGLANWFPRLPGTSCALCKAIGATPHQGGASFVLTPVLLAVQASGPRRLASSAAVPGIRLPDCPARCRLPALLGCSHRPCFGELWCTRRPDSSDTTAKQSRNGSPSRGRLPPAWPMLIRARAVPQPLECEVLRRARNVLGDGEQGGPERLHLGYQHNAPAAWAAASYPRLRYPEGAEPLEAAHPGEPRAEVA